MQTVDLLRHAAAIGASDLHLVPDMVPLVRIDGQLSPIGNCPALPASQCAEMVIGLLNAQQRHRLEKEWSLDFTIMLDMSRFRANVFYQRNGLEAVFRVIPAHIPRPDDLGLPPSIMHLADITRGLVLVTGPTGSGKSTTLACLIDLINERRHANIITIEDPIEFIYANKNCVISQREIGLHAPSFGAALKYVLRQDPDVVLLGEMRDLETISAAITVAETGHLVFATLHSVDSAQAVDRIIDVFPANQQPQIRAQLAGVLRSVIAQTLLPRANGRGRVAAREIMHVTPAIASLIRQGKTHEIYAAIDMGASLGMIGLGRSVAELINRGIVSVGDGNEMPNRQPSKPVM